MTTADKIILVGMLFIAIISLFTVNIFFYGNTTTSVIIEVNGKNYAKYNFNNITSRKLIEIKTQYGYNKVEINENKVRIVEANCPDQLCVNKGWISKSNQMVICLPHRLVVKITGEDTGVDGVAY